MVQTTGVQRCIRDYPIKAGHMHAEMHSTCSEFMSDDMQGRLCAGGDENTALLCIERTTSVNTRTDMMEMVKLHGGRTATL
jgi:hypothetical protein